MSVAPLALVCREITATQMMERTQNSVFLAFGFSRRKSTDHTSANMGEVEVIIPEKEELACVNPYWLKVLQMTGSNSPKRSSGQSFFL